MNLKAVTKSTRGSVALEGVSIEWEWRDDGLYAVTLTDSKGRVLKISQANYCMQAYLPAPIEKKTVYAVKGQVRTVGTPVREEFENDWEAQQRARELSSADVLDGAATVEKEEVEIPF